MPNQPKTPHRQVRMDEDLWAELGQLAALEGTDRSAVIRELAEAWCKRTRRRLEREASMRAQLRAVTRA